MRSFVTADQRRRQRETTAQQQYAAGEKTAREQHAAAEHGAQQNHTAAIKRQDEIKSRQVEQWKNAASAMHDDWGQAVATLGSLGVGHHDLPPKLEKSRAQPPAQATSEVPLKQLTATAKQIERLRQSANSLLLRQRSHQARQRRTLAGVAVAVVVLAVAGYFVFQRWSYDQRIAALQQEGAAILAAVKQHARTNPMDGAVYVPIPAGEFLMGSPEGVGYGEHPQHTVYLDAFWIMQTEVTNAQYAKCVAAGACSAPGNNRWQDAAYANHPVTDVDWNQASTYAQWAGGRLPTEAEWEKAARGTDGRTYPWGEEAPAASLVNCCDFVNETSPVGSYPTGASPYGALDMAGNVWEWTADWYDSGYYSQSPAQNPTGPGSGNSRVLRGGSWYSDGNFVRSAFRGNYYPDDWGDDVGFRCVRSQ